MFINDIFNEMYILQNAQKEKHDQQVKQVIESTQKLKDFLDSTEEIDPSYQQLANAEFCAILLEYMKKHSLR